MVLYPYSFQAAFDPNTGTAAPRDSVGQVYPVGDTSFANPLPTFDLNGMPVTLVVGEHGYLPDFQVEDHTAVVWKSGEYVFQFATTIPVKGDPGEVGKSAYQAALEQGFEGTESEWLETLKGANVVPTEEVLAPYLPRDEAAQSFIDKSKSRMGVGVGALANLPEDYDIGGGGAVIALGYNAMGNMTDVKKSVAIGANALGNGTKSRDNVAIGEDALWATSSLSADYTQAGRDGTRNVAIGGLAGRANLSGIGHVFIGRGAGANVVSGNGTVLIGSNAQATSQPIGFSGQIENWAPAYSDPERATGVVGIGRMALWANTAENVTALGSGALAYNTKGTHNVAVGTDALGLLGYDTWFNGGSKRNVNISGTYSHDGNTLTINATAHGAAVGDYAQMRLLDGDSATFSGDYAIAKILTTTTNSFTVAHPVSRTASGAAHVNLFATGTPVAAANFNTAVGSGALTAQRSGGGNTALGYVAAGGIVSGGSNIAIGSGALNGSNTPNNAATSNVAVGPEALNRTSGNSNVAIGWRAMYENTTGGFNTVVGYNAGRTLIDGTAATAMSNVSILGQDAKVSGNSQVQIGNSASTTYVYGTVQNRSDERDKADIRDTVLGLDFIEKLRPVDYRWDMREDYDWGERDGSKKRQRFHHGVIAQEVAQVVEEAGVEFGGLQDHSVNGGADVMSIGYDELIAPLIKAVQELSAEVRELKAQQKS